MEGEYADSYRKLRHALSSDCGKGWVRVSEIEPTIELLGRYATKQQ